MLFIAVASVCHFKLIKNAKERGAGLGRGAGGGRRGQRAIKAGICKSFDNRDTIF